MRDVERSNEEIQNKELCLKKKKRKKKKNDIIGGTIFVQIFRAKLIPYCVNFFRA